MGRVYSNGAEDPRVRTDGESYNCVDGIPKTPGSHPTVGMLHQSTGSSEWMLGVLKPVTTGSLNVSVRFVSGQSSTFNVKSSMTVGAVKALVAADAILAPLESSPSAAALGLMYLGKVLEDDKTLESYLVADYSTLIQMNCTPESKAEVEKFTEKMIAEVAALTTVRFPSHTANLAERVKFNAARGLDLDYDLPSWHHDYKPYAQYIPPKEGLAQCQSAEYEREGDQAWRRDYYINGPGNQAEVNNEYAILNAPEETE